MKEDIAARKVNNTFRAFLYNNINDHILKQEHPPPQNNTILHV